MRGAGFLLTVLAFALGAVLASCGGDSAGPGPSPAVSAPTTVQDFMARLTAATTREGMLFHTLARASNQLPNQLPTPTYSVESWIDVPADSARFEFRKDPTWDADFADYSLEIAANLHIYADEGDRETAVTAFADRLTCPGLHGAWVVMEVMCGPFTSDLAVNFRVVPNATLDGTPTYAIGYEGFGHTFRLHVDPATFLPVARETSFSQNSQPAGRSLVKYENDFVARASLPANFLDPSVVGYEEPATRQLQTLDDPAVGVPVYWLGRSFDAGSFGLLTLQSVEFRAPGVPGAGPGTRLGLRYIGSTGGVVTLEYWPLGVFESFAAQLGNGFVWAHCSDSREFDVGGATAIIRMGHEPGQRLIPGAGNTPVPTATVPNACSATPNDRFMAEVHYQDVVVTVDAPLSLVDEDGARFGQFDSEAALHTLVGGLRLRSPGE